MSSADDSFKPDKIIKAKKGESRWKVAANERTRIMLPHFIDIVRWEGVGWPRVLAPGATATVVADCVNFGRGSGVDITVFDSEGNFEETVHKTVYGYDVKLQFRVPNKARGLLLVKVSIPKADRPDWDAGLEEGDLEQMAPAVKIVPSLLQQVRFEKDEVVEGEDISMTVQTSPDKTRYLGSMEVGRMEEYGGQEVYIRHAGPFYEHPHKAGGYKITWNVTTPMIDRSEITAQWQIDEAKAEAEENGETYSGPDEYRGIELIARAKHLGLQADSTEASSTGPDWKGTLTVLDPLRFQLIDGRTGAAYAEQEVDLTLPDGTEETVTTDANAIAELERVPPGPVRIHADALQPLPDSSEAPDGDRGAGDIDPRAVLRMDDDEPTATIPTGSLQTVAVTWPAVDLRFENGFFGVPARPIQYTLQIETPGGENPERRGTLNAEGRLVEPVPRDVMSLRLLLHVGENQINVPLSIDAIDGQAENSAGKRDEEARTQAACQRLRCLGMLDGRADAGDDEPAAASSDEVSPDALRHALRIFQEQAGLYVTGELDDSTEHTLRHMHIRTE